MLSFGTVSLDVDYVYGKLAVVFRTWGGLCIRERGRIVSELRVCSGDLETCFEDWIGTTCLEAWIGGCAEGLLGIAVLKLLLFLVWW